MAKPKLRHVAIKTDDVHKEAAFWSKSFDLEQVGGHGDVAVFLSDGVMNLAIIKIGADGDLDFFTFTTVAGDSITDGWITTRPGERIFHTSFDDRPTEHVYAGTGAYSGLKREVNTLLTVPANSLTEGERYVASYWTYTRGHLRNHALTCVAQRDPGSGREDWITCGDMRFARIVNGDWSLVELPFTANKDEDEYRVFVEGRRSYRDTIWCDEVMVRPAYTHTFKVLERTDGRITKVIFNGQVLTRPR